MSNLLMRRLLLALTFGTACASPQPAAELPAEAQVIARYPLAMAGGTIGTVMAIVRCGSVLYVSDTDSRIHRIDTAVGSLAPIVDGSMMPMALAADCERNRVWAISPLPRGGGLRAVAFDTGTGRQAAEIAIPVPCFATNAVVSGDELFVGGECIHGMTGGRYVQPEAVAYYANKRIGVRVSLTSGEVTNGLVPYETSCNGAGACVGGSIATDGGQWIAAVRSASRVGVYTRSGDLVRTMAVSSPAFVTDGVVLPSNAASEQSVNWATRNSLIHRAFAVRNRVVVAHYLTVVPPGWKMGGPDRPQFKAWMNVMSADGQPLKVDVRLPELPIGNDDESLYVIDYGPAGRQGAHESVTVLRVAVPEA